MKIYAAASFKIKDFQQFKAELDSMHDSLHTYGLVRTWLNRDLDDANHLIIVHEVDDLPKAREFYRSPQYKECIQRAGVIGEPEIVLMEELMETPQLESARRRGAEFD